MKSTYYGKALENVADTLWVTVEDTYETIEWVEGVAPVSKEVVEAEVERLQAEYEAQEYARNRKAEYDALNQFELISDDSINGTTTHKDAILAIKAKYPKP